MFMCGSFNNREDDDIDILPCPSPKSSSKRSTSLKKKQNENRFANRGLDKFYALLSQLDEKKQKIFTQKGAEDISLVRFVITNQNEIKPIIVVKVKEKRQIHHAEDDKLLISQNLEEIMKIEDQKVHENDQKMRKRYMHFDFKLERLKQPVYYLPVFLMLVLLFLAIYGKSFAVLCTSILWYIIPAIQDRSSSDKESRKGKRPMKKEFTRRFSEKIFVTGNNNKQENNNGQLSSPSSVINGSSNMLPGKKHGHRRSF